VGRHLGPAAHGGLLIAFAVIALAVALRELRRLSAPR